MFDPEPSRNYVLSLAYTIAYSLCAPRPTDPVPRGQLWPTGPIYSLYAAYMQPISQGEGGGRDREKERALMRSDGRGRDGRGMEGRGRGEGEREGGERERGKEGRGKEGRGREGRRGEGDRERERVREGGESKRGREGREGLDLVEVVVGASEMAELQLEGG